MTNFRLLDIKVRDFFYNHYIWHLVKDSTDITFGARNAIRKSTVIIKRCILDWFTMVKK